MSTQVLPPEKLPTQSSQEESSIIQGQYSLDVRINDLQYPASPSSIRNLRIFSNIHSTLPSVSFEASDIMSFLTNEVAGNQNGENTIGDGISLSVGISDGNSSPEVHHFIINSIPKAVPGTGHMNVQVVGHLDAFKWSNGIVRGAYKGTSTEVIRLLSKDCGLGFYGPHSFNDNMVWIPANSNYSQFAKMISKHAWADDSSCPLICMDRDAVIRFVDMNRLADERPIATFKYLREVETDTDIEALSVSVKANSGANNLVAGYSGIMVSENMKGEFEEFSDIEAVKQGNFLNVSNSMREEVGLVRSQLKGFNSGNFHDNYRKAEYQNFRQNSMYSNHVYVYTNTRTDIGLIEVVDLDMGDQIQGREQLNYSGSYIVTAKTCGINGNRYFEKFRLSSNSKGYNSARDLK